MRLELDQTSAQLVGIIDLQGSRLNFVGFVTEQTGIAGSAEFPATQTMVSVRLGQTGTGLTGVLVLDSFAQAKLQTSTRYDVTVPLRRE